MNGMERQGQMFSKESLAKLDTVYFNIIVADEMDVTIQSRNTGHFWYLHNIPHTEGDACIIFHKHKGSHPYHLHGRAGSVNKAIRSIKKHDVWQLNGRLPSKG